MSSVMVPYTFDGKYRVEIQKMANGLKYAMYCVAHRVNPNDEKIDFELMNQEFYHHPDWKSAPTGIKLLEPAGLDCSNADLFVYRKWYNDSQSYKLALTNLGELVMTLADIACYLTLCQVQMPLEQYVLLQQYKSTLDTVCHNLRCKK